MKGNAKGSGRQEPARKTGRPRPSRANGAPKAYPNIAIFHRRRGSAGSAESDYGANHYDDYSTLGGIAAGAVRVTYVHDTGDFYAIDESDGYNVEYARVALLGTLVNPDRTPASPEKANALMEGWLPRTGQGRPLSWFVSRLNEVNRNGSPRQT